MNVLRSIVVWVARQRPTLRYMYAADPTLLPRKRDSAFMLKHIRAQDTLKLVRDISGLTSAEFSEAFYPYIRALEMEWAEGTSDEHLVEQIEGDPRLDDTERTLLFEVRAEMSLRDLEALMNGVYEVELTPSTTPEVDGTSGSFLEVEG